METIETRKKLADGIRQLQAKGDTNAVNQLVTAYKAKYQPAQTQAPVAPTSSATFPSVAGENPLVAGAKAVGNLPSSVFNLGKGLVDAIRNPKETVKSVVSIPIGAGAALTRKALGDTTTPTSGPEEQFNAFAQVMKERYGSLEALQKTATEDPFAFGADILGVLEGGASLVGKTSQLNKAIGTVGKTTLSPASKAAAGIADTSKGMARFATSQATGLNPDTITELVKNPQAFKNINPELRVQTAAQVADVLDQRLGELSDMGKGYEAIRQSDGIVTIPPNTIRVVLNKYGVKLDEGNKIVTSPESRPLSAGDRLALQDFIDNYGSVTTHTNNSFLNTREALSNLSKYDSTKTNFSTNIARELRSEYDKYGKTQVKGLKDLDTAYAPERELLGQLKKDIIDSKTGDLKDGAISKIANLTGKGKERVLERVKQIVPDIEERVRVLKAVEDIERAGEFKVGTYARAGLGVTGIVTGNVPAIIGAILAQPEIAVPLLKGAGYVGQRAAPILEALKNIANDVNNFRLSAQFKNSEGQMKLGMSIEDVSKGGNWKKLQEQNPDLFNKGILRKSLSPQGAKGVIPENIHSIQGKWQNYGEFDEISADKVYKRIDSGAFKGEYEDKFGNPIRDKTGDVLQDVYDDATGEWIKPMVSNKELRNELLAEFSTKEGKQYLNEVINALPKNSDGTITAYRIGKIGGGEVQSYTLSEGMAKTFSNQGTSVLPAGTPGLPAKGYKDFGALPTNTVSIDPKGIKAWSPYDAEILVEPKFVKTASKSDNLLSEARKYKSAEDFVKAKTGNQGIYDPVYEKMIKENRAAAEPFDFDLMENVLGSTPETKGDLVKVYRATTNGKILPGDNVSIYDVRQYIGPDKKGLDIMAAKMGITKLSGRQDVKFVEQWIPKKDLYQTPAGTQLYAPDGMKSLTDIWKKANKK